LAAELLFARETKSEPAAYERAAVVLRGGWVLIESQDFKPHCQTAVGFFVAPTPVGQ